MVLAAPELVIAEPVELLDQVEIAAELQHRMLADRMMRGEEGAEIQTRHGGFSWVSVGHAARVGRCVKSRTWRKPGEGERLDADFRRRETASEAIR